MKKLSLKNLLGLIACATVLIGSATASHAAIGLDYAVYDSISGIDNGVNGAFSATTESPRTFIGDVVNFYYPPSGPVTVTGLDLGFAYRGAATTLSALNVNIVYYQSASSTGDVLVSPITSVVTYDVRQPIVSAYNTKNGTNFTVDNFVFNQANYFYQLELPTTIQFSDSTVNGIAINYSANAGAGLFTNDTLTSVLRVGPSIARGSKAFTDPRGGFLRNASGRTDYNFNQDDARTLTVTVPNGGPTFANNAGIAMRIYSNVAVVPESNTANLLLVGASILGGAAIIRRRTAKQ